MLTNTHQKNAGACFDSQPTGDAPAPASSAFRTPSRCSTHFQMSATTTGDKQHRVEEHAAEKSAPEYLAIEHQRRDQRERDHQPHLQHGELARVEDRAPEEILPARRRVEIVLAFEQRLEVLESGERPLRRVERDAARECEIEVDDDRQEREEAEDREVRRDEHPGDARNADEALHPAHRRVERIENRAAERPQAARAADGDRDSRMSGGRRAPAMGLLAGRLHLLVDVRTDSLQRVVEGHFTGDGLPEPRRGRIEDRAVELVALDLVRDGRELRHLGDERYSSPTSRAGEIL